MAVFFLLAIVFAEFSIFLSASNTSLEVSIIHKLLKCIWLGGIMPIPVFPIPYSLMVFCKL